MDYSVLEKISKRTLRVAVIGLGYVGLPLATTFAEAGFLVTGIDVDQRKVDQANRGESYIADVPDSLLRRFIGAACLNFTSDYTTLDEKDAIIICVPTPLGKTRDPDVSYVLSATQQVKAHLRPDQLVILESTTYPGTTEEILLERFRTTGLEVGKDYFLVFSPEREDPGNAKFSTRTIPKVVGGITADCLEVGKTLYSQVIDRVITVSSTRAAELVKLLENIYRSVNIALVNELKLLTHRMNIDIWEVIDAAATKPFGYTAFYPGPGLGGHCIPIDPFYLSWKAKEYDFSTRFIQLAGEVNTAIPHYVVEQIGSALNDHSKSIRGAKILILGVAYKKDVDDVRESPALEIMELLQAKGASLSYSDPYIPRLHKMRAYDFSHMSSLQLTENVLKDHDIAVITTDHTSFDYQFIVDHATIVVDTRNATRNVKQGRSKIVRA